MFCLSRDQMYISSRVIQAYRNKNTKDKIQQLRKYIHVEEQLFTNGIDYIVYNTRDHYHYALLNKRQH